MPKNEEDDFDIDFNYITEEELELLKREQALKEFNEENITPVNSDNRPNLAITIPPKASSTAPSTPTSTGSTTTLSTTYSTLSSPTSSDMFDEDDDLGLDYINEGEETDKNPLSKEPQLNLDNTAHPAEQKKNTPNNSSVTLDSNAKNEETNDNKTDSSTNNITENPLFAAIMSEDIEAFNKNLEENLNKTNQLGKSALQLAASKNQLEMVERLLINGADPTTVHDFAYTSEEIQTLITAFQEFKTNFDNKVTAGKVNIENILTNIEANGKFNAEKFLKNDLKISGAKATTLLNFFEKHNPPIPIDSKAAKYGLGGLGILFTISLIGAAGIALIPTIGKLIPAVADFVTKNPRIFSHRTTIIAGGIAGTSLIGGLAVAVASAIKLNQKDKTDLDNAVHKLSSNMLAMNNKSRS